jgi:Na+-transporting NADH:ubiquinone oxidoreductase subunit NqrB
VTDPRLYQILSLVTLLVWGVLQLDFDIGVAQIGVTLGTALGTQWACTLWRGLERLDLRSSLISGLSLCLLLRVDHLWIAALAAFLSIASKFVLRWNGKHVWNPTNFGIATAILLTGDAWVSPGQWGSTTWAAFLFVCMGGVVVNRATRADVTFAFLLTWVGLVFGRSIWLGDPLAIPFHRVQSGAFLLFAFFMISDPRTTPDARGARVLYGAAVAFVAWYIQFRLFRTNGMLWSLYGLSLLVPVLDHVWRGVRYAWPSQPATKWSLA